MRKQYLDNIRWITIVLVVIFHIYYYYNNIGKEAMFIGVPEYTGRVTFAGIFQYFVYPWFMVLLFVVAGISARCALTKRTEKEFMKSRVDKILVPSTLGIVAFGWIGGYIIFLKMGPEITDAIPGFIKIIIILLSGTGALWFCHTLFLATLILMLIRCIIKKCKSDDYKVCKGFENMMQSPITFSVSLLIMCLILCMSAKIFNIPMVTCYRNGIYTAAFLMGYYIFSNDGVIEKLKKYIFQISILTIVSVVFYMYHCYGLSYEKTEVVARLDYNIYAFLMMILVIGVAAKFLNKSNKFTIYMNNTSFGIYVMHIPVLLLTNLILVRYNLPLTLVYAIELVSAFTFSILLYEIIRRIPILRYWIFGIRKSKNKSTEKIL